MHMSISKEPKENKHIENEFAKPSAEAVLDPGPPGLKLSVNDFHDFPLAEFHCKVFILFSHVKSPAVFSRQFLAFVCCDSLALHTDISDVCGHSQHILSAAF